MRQAIRWILCFAIGIAACAGSAQAERRVALVIGNGAYEHAPRLTNPRNDAEDVAAALERTGFETLVGLDLSQAEMQRSRSASRGSRARPKWRCSTMPAMPCSSPASTI